MSLDFQGNVGPFESRTPYQPPLEQQSLPTNTAELQKLVATLSQQQQTLLAENQILRTTLNQTDQRRAKLEDLYERAPMGYITIDEFGFILEANHTAAVMLGIQKSVLGRLPLETFMLKEDSVRFFEHRRKLLRRGGHSSCELTLKPRNRASYPVRIESIVLSDGSWLNSQIRLAISDISERRQLEEALRQQEKLAALGQLTGGIAHDFNNILLSIIATSDVLSFKYDQDEYLQPRVERIRTQAERAAELVGQLLAFGRQSKIELSKLELREFLLEVEGLLQRTLSENILVSFASQKAAPYWVAADQGQLQQVMLNLAINASHAMESGGKLTIGLENVILAEAKHLLGGVLPAGTWHKITVKDTGQGIAPELLPHILEPFFTTKPQGKGNGLGLAQVFGIIQQHGGGLDIQSQCEFGTIVTVYMPAAATAASQNLTTNNLPVTNGHGELILLIEDEEAVLAATSENLRNIGYKVEGFIDSRIAITALETGEVQPELILSDVVMPHLTGQRLLDRVSSINAQTPIVFMTGYMPEDMATLPQDKRVKAFLQKPFTVATLARVLASVLKR